MPLSSPPTHPTRRSFLRGAAVWSAFAATIGSRSAEKSSASESRIPVIDAHVHVGTAHQMVVPWNTGGDPEEILRNMRKGRIDLSVVFPMTNPTRQKQFAEGNREIAEICRRYPGRFIGFAKHDAVAEKGRIRELLRVEVLELGLVGYKSHQPQPTREVMEAVAELELPYIYHPARVSDLVAVARDFPQVDMIMAHGGPYSMVAARSVQSRIEAIEAAARYPNIYLETSRATEIRLLERALREAGPEKLCFGSDAPDCDARLEIFKIRLAMANLQLAPEKQAMVLGGNLLRLIRRSGRKPLP
jgi:predicted TIM-barrel fold metal-dependent hydrolase